MYVGDDTVLVVVQLVVLTVGIVGVVGGEYPLDHIEGLVVGAEGLLDGTYPEVG